MSLKMYDMLDTAISNLKAAGLFKPEFSLQSTQGHRIEINGKRFLNLTSNDFLGLATAKSVQEAAVKAMNRYGAGLASSRVVTGTQPLHQDVESELAKFLGKPDAILFSSLHEMASGFFEPLLNDQDYIFSDIYTNPSLINGMFQSPAQKLFFLRNDLNDLEDQLKRSPKARFRIVLIEGVYHLDGQIADLRNICDLARQYDALVMVHDTYGIGVLGEKGSGSGEYCEVSDKIDLVCGTFAAALGGFELGFVAGPKQVINWLRQNSKPHVYCASPSPMILGAAKEALKCAVDMKTERKNLIEGARDLRARLNKAGLNISAGSHPIMSITTGDAVTTQKLADSLFDNGFFTLGLCYPIVPKEHARIRIQLNVGHSERDIGSIANSVVEVCEKLKLVNKKK